MLHGWLHSQLYVLDKLCSFPRACKSTTTLQEKSCEVGHRVEMPAGYTEAYSEPYQPSKMGFFANKPLIFSAKNAMCDI